MPFPRANRVALAMAEAQARPLRVPDFQTFTALAAILAADEPAASLATALYESAHRSASIRSVSLSSVALLHHFDPVTPAFSGAALHESGKSVQDSRLRVQSRARFDGAK